VNAPLHQFKAELFGALAHPVRLRILELLRRGEQTVGALQAQLQIDPSSVSQHLAVLRSRRLLGARKVGTSVYYRVLDPQVFVLLDAGREIFEAHVHELQGVLDAQREEDEAQAAAALS
jgi:DNA-binding transcriptional ArsR family regulator